MNLRAKVMLILISVWVVICTMVIVDSKLIIAENYRHLENMLTQHRMQDVERAYNRLLYGLSIYTLAWSQWDDAYHFLEAKNEPFIKTNFVSAIYRSADLNFIIFYDVNNNLYYGRAYDAASDAIIDVPPLLIKYFNENKFFLKHHNNPLSSKVGILQTKLGLIVMSSRPVVMSNAKSPVIGTILMGYYLDNTLFATLSDIVGMKTNFIPLSSIQSNPIASEALKKINQNNQYVYIALNKKLKLGYFLLKDINQNPIGLIQIEMPRIIYQSVLSTVYHYIAIIILSGIIIILIMGYLLKIFVLNRIISINYQLNKVNREIQFDQKIHVSGHDELNNMVYTINNMLSMIHHSQAELRYLATHDPLTKLPDRDHFYNLLSNAMKEAKTNHTKIAIMFLDMDKLKQANDKYGHAAGDQLIMLAADRIRQAIRSVDILGHQSGDEFILFMPDITDTTIVSETANNILKSTSEPFVIQNHAITVSFSIGICIYPDDGTQLEELVRKADHLMYIAKNKSGNNFQYSK